LKWIIMLIITCQETCLLCSKSANIHTSWRMKISQKTDKCRTSYPNRYFIHCSCIVALYSFYDLTRF
jgi:hypothetical protein